MDFKEFFKDGQKIDEAIIDKMLDAMKDEIPEEGRDQARQIFKAVFMENKLLKDAMGFSDTMIQAVYNEAKRLYDGGQYGRSEGLFQMLGTLDPKESEFMFCLGACLQQQKKYEEASLAYMAVGWRNPEDPRPFFHAADCFIHLGDKQKAFGCAYYAATASYGKEEYQQVMLQAETLLDTLREELEESGELEGVMKKSDEMLEAAFIDGSPPKIDAE